MYVQFIGLWRVVLPKQGKQALLFSWQTQCENYGIKAMSKNLLSVYWTTAIYFIKLYKIILIGVLHLPPICMTILKCSSDNVTLFENNHDHVIFYHLTTGVKGLRSIYETADGIPSNYLKAVFHKFYLARSWILCPKCNFNLPCSCRSQLNSAGT